jgi:hypothetical protein
MRSRIGFYFSPEFSSRIITQNINASIYNQLKKQQIPEMGYSIGFNFRHQIHNEHYIVTGISILMQSINEKFHPYTGYPVLDSLLEPSSIKSRYNFAYLAIPLQYQWCRPLKKIRIGAFVGAKIAYLAFALRNDWYNDNLAVREEYLVTKDFSRFIIFGNLGMVFNVNASDNVDFEFRPHFRISAYPAISDVKLNFYSIGMEVDMGINFNKKKSPPIAQ